MACPQCDSPKQFKQDEKFYVSGNWRYYTRVIFCEDCKYIVHTDKWSEEIVITPNKKGDDSW